MSSILLWLLPLPGEDSEADVCTHVFSSILPVAGERRATKKNSAAPERLYSYSSSNHRHSVGSCFRSALNEKKPMVLWPSNQVNVGVGVTPELRPRRPGSSEDPLRIAV